MLLEGRDDCTLPIYVLLIYGTSSRRGVAGGAGRVEDKFTRGGGGGGRGGGLMFQTSRDRC